MSHPRPVAAAQLRDVTGRITDWREACAVDLLVISTP